MSTSLKLSEFALRKGTPVLNLTLAPGQVMSVFGPAASGKSSLLKCIAGEVKAPTGKVTRSANVALAARKFFNPKSTPVSVAKATAGKGGSDRIAETLSALNLWEQRSELTTKLSHSQQTACELVGPLASDSDLLLIDCQLDGIDPWTRRSCMELLRRRSAGGTALVIASNIAQLALISDIVVVLSNGRFAFSGTYQELLERGKPSRLEVRARSGDAVRALAGELDLEIQSRGQAIELLSSHGKELAAKLLLEGYGEVQAVTLSEPSPEELIRSVLR